ncbi:MAG: DUF72 domain-containing protein [Acidimicrobiales bacterium]
MDAPVLRVGCPMWAHRPWAVRLFGPTPTGEELAAYARWCSAVEGNTTFYALPRPETVQRWADQAPEGFRFCFKLPRTITHERRLRNADDALEEFCERLSPLAAHLGPMAVQLPATFGPEDLGVLERFVEAVPRSLGDTGLRWGVEVRHRDFEAEGRAERALGDLLAAHDVDRILIDTRGLFSGPRVTPGEVEAWERKPRLRVRPVATGPMPIVRFVGLTDPEANPTWWAPWVAVVARWLEAGLQPTFFVHTPDNDASPTLARRFHDEVRALVPDLAPLPEPAARPVQPGLFEQ